MKSRMFKKDNRSTEEFSPKLFSNCSTNLIHVYIWFLFFLNIENLAFINRTRTFTFNKTMPLIRYIAPLTHNKV